MKSFTLTLPLLALLGATTASFVACGTDSVSGTANGGTSGNAGKGSTSGSGGTGGGGGGSSNSAGSAGEPICPSAGCGGAAASGGAASAGAAGASSAGAAGAASGGAGDGGTAGAGGAALVDQCGGCNYSGPAPQICIYQAGGPGAGRFVCATQNPCGAAGACACIVGQGTCNFMLEGGSPGYCVCDNGLD